ncbi:TPA: hypothetical protein H9337_002864 [Listeria monocytogenes]|uniref:hypothetical protein n=2 Tax=Listeria monocytogenes TaxID=1639 RepID=UPI000434018E|nr:hypothetical protein [Listeria monocytogenes]CDK41801.1 hypothetical protein LMQOC1_70012 [Listeria monocytogenes QOC1]HAA2246312.1 hypothetical protein [Listeria monocytogenes]HAA2258016.1 hypothetical protein [Listeria monocytogenes]HAM1362271.1 hypothetical protein [Listeria monocytogenes]HBN5071735.1 hypothetical protein [Listeria monocytogenes]
MQQPITIEELNVFSTRLEERRDVLDQLCIVKHALFTNISFLQDHTTTYGSLELSATLDKLSQQYSEVSKLIIGLEQECDLLAGVILLATAQ